MALPCRDWRRRLLLVPSLLSTWIWPSSRPPCMTRSRPSTNGSNPTRRASLEPRERRTLPLLQRRMMSLSPSSRTRPPHCTRPTRNTWRPMASRRMTLGCAPGSRLRQASSRCGPTTGASPRRPPPPFVGGTALGEWRPTPSLQPPPPPSDTPMMTPWLGTVVPFTLKSGDQFRATAPPPLTSTEYAKDYNEVKALGARATSTRTPEQTQLAYFYAGNNFILWHRALRDIAAAHTTKMGDNARLLALGTLASADAVITAWDGKRHYDYWRPITAIREGEQDSNAQTAGDPTWEPFLNTPPYPEYPSGANNVVGALTRTLELFFGTDQMPFTVVSEHPLADPKTRTYQRFSALAQDTVDVRIYHGVHFRSADEEIG